MDITTNQHNTLILSVGLNYYDRMFQRCIDSHRQFADRHGYQYLLINKPVSATITASAWLKIPLMLAALGKGYDWVMFVDADCEIKPSTPALATLTTPNHSLYMANGFSGRLNSGVIITRNSLDVIQLLGQVYANCDQEVDSADWGENGHLIHFTRNWPGLKVLESIWNNNADPDLNDYIRHYSAGGPMRNLYAVNTRERWTYLLITCYNRLQRNKYISRGAIKPTLEKLILEVLDLYPVFTKNHYNHS
jgi:hypothetical protein